MTVAGRDRAGRRLGPEVEVSVASDGVCAQQPVHDGGLPDAGDPLARPHPEVSQ